jgi:hypothetical protein
MIIIVTLKVPGFDSASSRKGRNKTLLSHCPDYGDLRLLNGFNPFRDREWEIHDDLYHKINQANFNLWKCTLANNPGRWRKAQLSAFFCSSTINEILYRLSVPHSNNSSNRLASLIVVNLPLGRFFNYYQ